jgi:hypothetical protein
MPDAIMVYPEGEKPGLPEHKFYNGEVTLRFDRDKWTYFKVEADGSLIPQNGVTSVVKIIDKSEPLMRWAVRVAMERLKKLLKERGYLTESMAIPLFEEILDEIIEKAKKADKEELEAAGKTGHKAHAWIESYIKAVLAEAHDRRLELLAKLPEDERAANCSVAACGWMSDHNVRWIGTERRCYSRLYRYAGTMDGLAWVDSCQNPACCPTAFKDRLTLVDWKTSNYLYIEYLFQTAAYQQAYQEETGRTIVDRWIIRLGKDDAEFDPWHVSGEILFQQDFKGFRNALALYRSVHEVKDRIADVQAAKVAYTRAEEKKVRDAANLLACPTSGEYKGSRAKKGCNGTETLCAACRQKWEEKHHDENKSA